MRLKYQFFSENYRVDIFFKGYLGNAEQLTGDSGSIVLTKALGSRSDYIFSSSVDLKFYENPIFIDSLKTLGETDIRVDIFQNELIWQGFVLPDFFESGMQSNAILRLSATDRLKTLSDATLPRAEGVVTFAKLVDECLKLTGLNFNVNIVPYFEYDGDRNTTESFFSKVKVSRQRLYSGGDISALDILTSILVLTNSFVFQENGEWWIVNKKSLYNGGVATKYANGIKTSVFQYTPSFVSLSSFSQGTRALIPAASEVGVFTEFGGLTIHPANYDFANGLNSWATEISAAISTSLVTGYYKDFNDEFVATYANRVTNACAKLYKPIHSLPTVILPSFNSAWIPLAGFFDIEIDISLVITAPHGSRVHYSLEVFNDTVDAKTFNFDGVWQEQKNTVEAQTIYIGTRHNDDYEVDFETLPAVTVNHVETVPLTATDVGGTLLFSKLRLRVYGTSFINGEFFLHSAKILIRDKSAEAKGVLATNRTTRDFSMPQKIDTSIFGEFIEYGINGNVFSIRADETYIIRDDAPLKDFWGPGNEEFLIVKSSQQRAEMFSLAREKLTLEMLTFPLSLFSIFNICGNSFHATSLSLTLATAEANVVLEEIVASDTGVTKLESYTGGTERGISSIGSVSEGRSVGNFHPLGGSLSINFLANVLKVQEFIVPDTESEKPNSLYLGEPGEGKDPANCVTEDEFNAHIEDFEEHAENAIIHVTAADKTKWNAGGGGISEAPIGDAYVRRNASWSLIYYDDIQDSIYAPKPPGDAQKNSDITKEEIEAKLTGTITSHDHNLTHAQISGSSLQNFAAKTLTATDVVTSGLTLNGYSITIE